MVEKFEERTVVGREWKRYKKGQQLNWDQSLTMDEVGDDDGQEHEE